MPEPIMTPVRSRSSSLSGCQPESSTACTAAAMRIDDELVHPALVLRGDPVVGVEQPRFAVAARHLPGDARRQVGDIERLDRADPRFARDKAAPDVIEADAERRHEPHAGDDDPPHRETRPEPTANAATSAP